LSQKDFVVDVNTVDIRAHGDSREIDLECPAKQQLQSTTKNQENHRYSKIEALNHYTNIRQLSENLCKPLIIEDYGLQAMDDTSPLKWHLAHTSWFFETFILKVLVKNYQPYHTEYEVLFNSYYNGIGDQFTRSKRHLLSRPSVDDVYAYRAYVDSEIKALLITNSAEKQNKSKDKELLSLLELGCNHEQQHQELMLTDLKYCWFQNPLFPAYKNQDALTLINSEMHSECLPVEDLTFTSFGEGLYPMGHDTNEFCFDNEQPVHKVYIAQFKLADRLITNKEYLAFINDGGYENPLLWLSQGWSQLQAAITQEQDSAKSPLYWVKRNDQWFEYQLQGLRALDMNQPVIHINAYEADAYARWAGCRLPTEFEWEVAQKTLRNKASNENFLQQNALQPINTQLVGSAWQWTSSAYGAYPKYKPAEGAVGEYNGKFMVDQLVLKGGSCATQATHYRHSYRNFFYPKDKWQFTSICLASNDG
jgi:ergothioneine biosynthesis protein EgtB